ncbi:hypothetical protein NIZ92_07780 [Alcaligenes sp. 1735tsa3]|uniref:hypothetical protein n=1 Tax=Alcaligenes sp. 1735tsa3 TaxID=2953809 RepID=UPI0020A74294|nr:hypothetical protein [Alcaligenes sp. 1735tsa3]USY26931.1 hypothetical protein NIZ92_07780 [Alcaligenes sp. 1735tsa3]
MANTENEIISEKILTCGLIMPISSIDGLGSEHWVEVKSIIQDAVDSIDSPKFIARIVSDSDDVGVIHKRIVQGVYNADIVICDVSARNPNVMFELGMRLAFDKPTIIIKDDQTDYAFDTSIIEHISYPRDLRFSKIVTFKRLLADKLLATYKLATSDPNHSTFLKNFGTFKVAELDQKVGSGEQVMMEILNDIQQEVASLRRMNTPRPRRLRNANDGTDRIFEELAIMKQKNPSFDFEASDKLVSIFEKLLPAQSYFDSRADFQKALERACQDMKEN